MGRLRGFLWLTAGLVVAVLAGLVAFTTLSRAFSYTATISGEVPLGRAIPRQAPMVQSMPSSFRPSYPR